MTFSPQHVRVSVRDAVATVVLDRPPANAFDPGLIAELRTTLEPLAADPEVRCRSWDPVAALSRNRIELVDLLLGCAWPGAVAVPLNTALRGDSLAHVLTSSGARYLLLEAEFAGRVAEAGYDGVTWVIGTGPAPGPHGRPRLAAAVSALDPAVSEIQPPLCGPRGTDGRVFRARAVHPSGSANRARPRDQR
ncbi:AMP-binding protein [Nocardia zapadnayensis]|nr:AMP-binding protein [Nocardia zapadnayensis]MCX0274830.1 AMP-binding protein [Nocardia zapadnayensis]